MGEINWMTAVTGERPILLLDEVVAELDEQRRSALLSYVIGTTQTILTATDPGMFTDPFLQKATRIEIRNGRVNVM